MRKKIQTYKTTTKQKKHIQKKQKKNKKHKNNSNNNNINNKIKENVWKRKRVYKQQ